MVQPSVKILRIFIVIQIEEESQVYSTVNRIN